MKKQPPKKWKWRRYSGTYFLEDGTYGYAHVFKCQNYGLCHNLWCAVGTRNTTHDTLREAQAEIERQFSCRPKRANRGKRA